MTRVLNLYSGVGGNRKGWPDDVEVIAVEKDRAIGRVYEEQFPEDQIYNVDAHKFLLDNYQDFDFIWSSPPCQSHSKMIRSGRNRRPRYPDMKLYEEILFLQHNFKGKWVVENVVPYYTPLVPAERRGRHLFWSNFYIPEFIPPEQPKDFINTTNLAGMRSMQDWLGIHYDRAIYYESNHCPTQVLRNAVHPEIGQIIYEAAVQTGQGS